MFGRTADLASRGLGARSTDLDAALSRTFVAMAEHGALWRQFEERMIVSPRGDLVRLPLRHYNNADDVDPVCAEITRYRNA